MSSGIGLIKSIIVSGKSPIIMEEEYGISRDTFKSDIETKVFDFVYSHFMEYGKLPELRTIEADCNVKFHGYPDEPVEYWITSLAEQNAMLLARSMHSKIGTEIANGSLNKIEALYNDFAVGYNANGNQSPLDRPLDFHDTAEANEAAQVKRRISTKMSGVPFGFPYVDRVTDGAQASDTVAIVGNIGVGKTYLLFNMALQAYKAGLSVLIVPLEMSWEQCSRRLVALYSGVTSSLIRRGRLGYYGEQVLRSKIEEIQNRENRLRILDGSLVSTVERIGRRVQELKPDVVYVDGGYLLRSSSAKDSVRWERIAYTSEMIKQYAKNFSIPFFTSYQFNRGGNGMENIGGSAAVGQLASVVFSIQNEVTGVSDATWSPVSYKTLELIKDREGAGGKLRIRYDMERMAITQDSVISGETFWDDDL